MSITLSRWSKAPYIFINGELDDRIEEALDEELSYEVPDASHTDAWKRGDWDGRERLLRDSKSGNKYFPAGCLSRARRVLDALDVEYEVEGVVRPGRGDFDFAWDTDMTLRKYQAEAVRDAIIKGAGVVTMPTGGGKTLCGVRIAHELSRTTLVLCHRQEIADQWVDDLRDILGVDVARCYGGTRENGDVQVALYQSIYEDGDIRDDVRLDHDVLLADECVSGDSMITMADGSEKKMENVEVGDWVLSMSDDGAVEPRPVTRKWDKGVRDVVELDGLVATPDHEIYTPDGMVEAGDAAGVNVLASRERCDEYGIQLPEVWFGSRISGDSWSGSGICHPLRVCHPSEGFADRRAGEAPQLRPLRGGVHREGVDASTQEGCSRGERRPFVSGVWGSVRHTGGSWWSRCGCSWVGAENPVHIGANGGVLVGHPPRGAARDGQAESRRFRVDGKPLQMEGWCALSDSTEDCREGTWRPVRGDGVRRLWDHPRRGLRWGYPTSIRPSQERRRYGQPFGEFVPSVPSMPPFCSQQGRSCVNGDNKRRNSRPSHTRSVGVVEAGEAEPAGRERVYDIEVAGNHNFLADGFLVSNCHRVGADTFSKVALGVNAQYRFGFSATPEREDNATLKVIGGTGEILCNISPEKLIEDGYLAEPTWKIIETPGRADYYRNWQEEYKQYIVENPERNEIIASEVNDMLPKPCLVTVERIDHGERLVEMIDDAVLVHGDAKNRSENIQSFRDGDIDVMVATRGIVGEGFDVPEIISMVVAGGLKSGTSMIQQVGRALRPDTDEAVIVDFVDSGNYVGDHAEERIRTYKEYYGEYGP